MNENFSMQIKKELCTKLTDRDKKSACLYGLLLFSHRFSYNGDTSFRTECLHLALIFPNLLKNVFENVDFDYLERPLQNGNKSYTFKFSHDDVNIIVKEFNIKPIREIDLTKIDNNSMMSFISGVFLTCGSVSNPNKDYHLEFSVSQEVLANDLLTILKNLGFNFKVVKRKNFYIVYVKGSENIEDILTFMGAESSTLEVMNVKIFKSLQNRINRRSNCEKANYTRSLNAIQKQVDDIEYIDSTIGIENLPDVLVETAYIRLENPDMSLRELCEQFQEPIGRSGLNRRLQKISAIAQSIKDGTYD
ncbi:MAG: DNA-binding protein WhiA [Ruminococcus sp.]|nr:DNA-binding protein WhiA [Ruminococcus sp.]MCD7799927.1 DNA-binding protein WhiA [Ruminococcus sp.]